ncbi:nucleotidyltransferase domain-containing protein [Bacillus sp. FJAT-49736]|uniref:nucleotidyltransferase domain-containing protein n=1 Tax=Bacillus sp. FJAT-49736 TaxID=2833582 RepID=UPI001BC9758A|nr:nucleotidyltransferase domain-containing protein [Bacillus sp. FJAT-49736]MBS4174584.1 nucleotidyltransferase domain-containing protein [Bacillus sp. FJAT-49736]
MKEKLIEVEEEYHVRILFACEAGSRAWGLNSESSDYDVRFIYVHPLEWYLDIDQKREVIQHPITNSLDLEGWDLRKTLFLLRKSNPPLLEWLHSDIIYMKNNLFYDELKIHADKAFSAKSCIFHYLNMAKRNAKNILEKDNIKLKQYLNILRPLLACKAMAERNCYPTVNFPNLVAELIKDNDLLKDMNQLIDMKKSGQVYIGSQNLYRINKYIEDELLHLENYVQTIPNKKCDITADLNDFFRKIVIGTT